jgi:hypothetical protein
MHLLNTLPQRLDPGATPTFAGLISASLTAPASTNLTLAGGSSGASLVLGQGAAAGSATITPTGTGVVAIAGTGSKLTVAGTTAATSSITGSGIFGGGIGVAGSVVAGGTNNGTNEYSYPFLSSATTLGGFATYSSGATVNQRIWAIQHGSAIGDGVWRLRAINDALSSGSNAISITRTAEAIGTISLGTTTAIVSVLGTTAGSSGAGALVVAGGLATGAASYFGGLINVVATGQNPIGPAFTPLAWGTSSIDVNGFIGLYYSGAGKGYLAAQAAGGLGYNTQGAGTHDFFVLGTNRATISSTGLSVNGAATFAGAVTIGGNVGFYNGTPVAKPTGIAVTAAAIHAALVTLNLIAA